MLPPPDVIIVTDKSELEIAPMRVCVEGYCMDCSVIVTCREGKSLAENRNYGLDQATSPVVIMLDGLVQGFYRGWWRELIQPMENPSIVMLTARLMDTDGIIINMPYSDNKMLEPVEYVPVIPLMCCTIRNDGIRFEDTNDIDYRFMGKILAKTQGSALGINNSCKMIYGKKIIIQMGGGSVPAFKKPTENIVT